MYSKLFFFLLRLLRFFLCFFFFLVYVILLARKWAGQTDTRLWLFVVGVFHIQYELYGALQFFLFIYVIFLSLIYFNFFTCVSIWLFFCLVIVFYVFRGVKELVPAVFTPADQLGEAVVFFFAGGCPDFRCRRSGSLLLPLVPGLGDCLLYTSPSPRDS